MSGIKVGDLVIVTDAEGQEHTMIASSALEGRNKGHTFPVYWVIRERTDGVTDRVPWPAEYVRAASSIPTGGDA